MKMGSGEEGGEFIAFWLLINRGCENGEESKEQAGDYYKQVSTLGWGVGAETSWYA